MYELVASDPDSGRVLIQRLDRTGRPTADARAVPPADLPQAVRLIEESEHPRWVWERTTEWYPALLAAGVEVARCHDLSLCAAILMHSAYTASSRYTPGIAVTGMHEAEQAAAARNPGPVPALRQDVLFEQAGPTGPGPDVLAAELRSQLHAVSLSPEARRLTLLLAAESAGSLIAAEMQDAGVPWDAGVHDALLTERLGPRPQGFNRPDLLEAKAAELRELLGAPGLNPDSPQDLVRALHRAGIETRSTRASELRHHTHPAIQPLLEYKKMARLLGANGWGWLDTWVTGGRFRPEYVVGGVVTGRWASRGGGPCRFPLRFVPLRVPCLGIGSSSRTPPSSSLASSPRSPETRRWRLRPEGATSTRESLLPASAGTARRPK